MTYDSNKGIGNIAYNTYIGKVAGISMTNGSTETYTYDGSEKLIRRQNTQNETWDYAGDYIFKNNALYQAELLEGRLVWEGTSWNYEFEYTDHNNSVTLAYRNKNGNQQETQRNTIDPYGLEIQPLSSSGADRQNFTFLKRETWAMPNWVNLNNRFYMPEIGRFGQVDPVTEFQESQSLYQYGWGNPVLRSDPNGAFPIAPAIPFLLEVAKDLIIAGAAIYTASELKKELSKGTFEIPAGGPSANSFTPLWVQQRSKQMNSKEPSKNTNKSKEQENKTEQKSTQKAEGNKKTFQTYTKAAKNALDKPYSGKTSGKGTPDENVAKRDKNHHKNQTHKKAVLDRSSPNSDAIRGREQQNIDRNGGAQKQGGNSGNTNRGVSEKNPKAKQYEAASNKEFN